MIMFYYFMVLLCICCLGLLNHWIQFVNRRITWSPLVDASSSPFFEDKSLHPCTTDQDCNINNKQQYKCFPVSQQTVCVPTADDNNTCNPETGDWVLTQSIVLKCVCKYPHLITQMGQKDCNIDVACGLHGHLKDVTINPFKDEAECICDDKQYISSRLLDRTPVCLPRQEKDGTPCYPYRLLDDNTCECLDQTVDSHSHEARTYFSEKYLNQFLNHRRCLKIPCTFNAVNGQPLQHGIPTFDEEKIHCLCDPRYGNFGVSLNVAEYTLSEDGEDSSVMNACASLFETENSNKHHLSRLTCRFYLYEREPLCWIQFNGNNNNTIVGSDKFAVIDPWPNNYFQHILQTERKYLKMEVSQCKSYWPFSYSCWWTTKSVDYIHDCDSNYTSYTYTYQSYLLNVFGDKFMCRYKGNHPLYHNRIILNPFAVSFLKLPSYEQTNGVIIEPDGERGWIIRREHIQDFFDYKLGNAEHVLYGTSKALQ